MPNHFHCIIENAPIMDVVEMCGPFQYPNKQYEPDNKKYNASIGDAVNWFKTMTTNEYIRGVKILN